MVPLSCERAGFRVASADAGADPLTPTEPMDYAHDRAAILANRRFARRAKARSSGAAAARRVRHANEVLRHRRDVAVLASFNDRMLADIGLIRGDLNDAFAEPPWRDPTAVLVARARERRAARRRSAWPWPEPRNVPAPSIVPQADECDAGHQVLVFLSPARRKRDVGAAGTSGDRSRSHPGSP